MSLSSIDTSLQTFFHPSILSFSCIYASFPFFLPSSSSLPFHAFLSPFLHLFPSPSFPAILSSIPSFCPFMRLSSMIFFSFFLPLPRLFSSFPCFPFSHPFLHFSLMASHPSFRLSLTFRAFLPPFSPSILSSPYF